MRNGTEPGPAALELRATTCSVGQAVRQSKLRGLHKHAARLFSGDALRQSVSTRVYFDAGPETVWSRIIFYEEVPEQPPFLLRSFLPCPVRSHGDKAGPGAKVECAYDGGDLLKRITSVERPHLVQFEVLEQQLGIEGCVRALGGSYRIRPRGSGSEITLTTYYLAYLRPRFLWRPVEKFLAGELHRHILRGMKFGLAESGRPNRRTELKRVVPERNSTGALACTASQSHSPR